MAYQPEDLRRTLRPRPIGHLAQLEKEIDQKLEEWIKLPKTQKEFRFQLSPKHHDLTPLILNELRKLYDNWDIILINNRETLVFTPKRSRR